MLSLTRLGLRGGEVARLMLGDVGWRTGEVTIRGRAAGWICCCSVMSAKRGRLGGLGAHRAEVHYIGDLQLSIYVRCAVSAVTSRVTLMSGVMRVVMVAVVSAVAVRAYTPLSSS